MAILAGPAQKLDPDATPQTFRVATSSAPDSVFEYMETASARAGIAIATAKLAIPNVAIIGLGGTGSYVLDLLAKTLIWEIHLYDGDRFLQHNAFRSPGCPSIEVLAQAPNKAIYLQSSYQNMRRGIVAHDVHITAGNVDELREMGFVFLCLDSGSAPGGSSARVRRDSRMQSVGSRKSSMWSVARTLPMRPIEHAGCAATGSSLGA